MKNVRVFVQEIENWFSACKPHMGANKKYKAHNSKYV
jgi:hypothetical protein